MASTAGNYVVTYSEELTVVNSISQALVPPLQLGIPLQFWGPGQSAPPVGIPATH